MTHADRANHDSGHRRTDHAGHVLTGTHQSDGVGQALAWDQRWHEGLLRGNQKRLQRPVEEGRNRQVPGLHETTHDVDCQYSRQEKGQYLTGEHQPAAIDAVDQCSTAWRDDEERQAGGKGHDPHEPW